MSFFSICLYKEGDDFKRLVAFSTNLEMLDFAHNLYVVVKSNYSHKVKEFGVSRTLRKRKAAYIVDLKRDEYVDVKLDDHI